MPAPRLLRVRGGGTEHVTASAGSPRQQTHRPGDRRFRVGPKPDISEAIMPNSKWLRSLKQEPNRQKDHSDDRCHSRNSAAMIASSALPKILKSQRMNWQSPADGEAILQRAGVWTSVPGYLAQPVALSACLREMSRKSLPRTSSSSALASTMPPTQSATRTIACSRAARPFNWALKT